jgi:hypothetical protein
MDEPVFSITQDTLNTLSEYLTDQQLTRLGTITKHVASPLTRLQQGNAYWKSRVAKIFPLSEEDYIPNWKEFYLAFTTPNSNPKEIQSQAVGKYLPLDLIQRWLSAHPADKIDVIRGLIAADREADFQAIEADITDARLFHNILSSSGGWQMLLNRLPTLHTRLQSKDAKAALRSSMESLDPAHFFLVRSLLNTTPLVLREWIREHIHTVIEYCPENLSIYFRYITSHNLITACSTYPRGEWNAVADVKYGMQTRQLLYEIVIPYYREVQLIALLARFPNKLLPAHLCILRGISHNTQLYSQNLRQDVEMAFLKHSRSLAEFQLFNSVFSDTISHWLAVKLLRNSQRDLTLYLLYSKEYPPEQSEYIHSLIRQKLGAYSPQQPEGIFTEKETKDILRFLKFYC